MSASASAATLKVTNTHDSGPGSLRHCINEANSNGGSDRIVIEATGTIRVAHRLPDLSSDLGIKGPGARRLTVSANAPEIFKIRSGHVHVHLSRMTIAKGGRAAILNAGGDLLRVSHTVVRHTFNGSGISNIHQGNLKVSHSTIRGNSASGIVNLGGTATVRDSTVRDNQGGILNEQDGNLKVSHSTIRGNSSRGIGTFSGTATVRDSTVRDNHGGGIANGGTAEIRDSVVRHNSAIGEGGGIVNAGGTLTVVRSTLAANTVSGGCFTSCFPGAGGGIFNAGEASISRSTLSGNSASGISPDIGIGGGIANAGDVAISQSTLSDNSASPGGGGGGIFNGGGGTTALVSTIVANSPSGDNCTGAVTSSGHNLADDGSCSLSGTGDQPSTEPQLRPLDDYGGPTKTFELRPSSPAIDAGFSDGAMTDQRGLPRVVDFPDVPMAVGGDNSDIGSFELQLP